MRILIIVSHQSFSSRIIPVILIVARSATAVYCPKFLIKLNSDFQLSRCNAKFPQTRQRSYVVSCHVIS